MTIDERYRYLGRMLPRYRGTNPRALRRAIHAGIAALLHPRAEAAEEPAA